MEKVLTSLLDKCEFNHDIIYDLVVDLVDYYDLNEYVESFSFKRLKTNGQDCVKTPIGLFDEDQMENDLKLVDSKIRDFYEMN